MFKWGVIAASAALLLAGNAMAEVKVNRGVVATADEMAQGSGFYWYDDYAPDDVNKTNPIKRKIQVTPQQKAQMSQMERMITALEKNNELQEQILAKLEYAFPRTIPEFTTNKKTGEKCRSNSSKDCFVMPVIAEAQQSVPVMANMLRDPSVENVKKYMEWQSVYLNQAFTVGHGFQLVGLQYERDVSKMDGTYHTQLPASGNLQNDVERMNRSAILMRLKHKLGVLLFLGKTDTLERELNGYELMSYSGSILRKLDTFAYIYKSDAARKQIEGRIGKYANSEAFKKYASVSKSVNPELFEKYNISVTPAAVVFYKKDDGEIVWQKLGYTMMSPQQSIDVIYSFLKFHKIIKPGAVNEELAYQIADQLRNKGDVDQSLLNQIEIDESHIKVDENQIAKKAKKK